MSYYYNVLDFSKGKSNNERHAMTPQEIERKVRKLLEIEYSTSLPETRLVIGRKSNGEDCYHKFDGVSPDKEMVFEVKSNQVKPSEKYPAGRYFSSIKWVLVGDVYYLSRIRAKTKLLVLTDKNLYEIFCRDMDGILPEDITIIYRNPEADELPDTALLSECSLAQDWNKPEEDEAWSHLQRE
ncbi:MAG TPA: hypothetical protein VF779_10120 [Pyrinomonadaceae bacterium]